MVILDCSAAVRIVMNTSDGRAMQGLIENDELVISSELMKMEVASAFWKYVHAGKMSKQEARDYIHDAIDLVDEFYAVDDFTDEVFGTAVSLDHSPYDMCYLVLARRFDATLLTFDEKLIEICENQGIDIVHGIALS